MSERLTAKKVRVLANCPGAKEGDRPIMYVTATEIRELAKAWLLLDDIDRRIATVIDPAEVEQR